MPKLIVDKGPDRSRSVVLGPGANLVFGRDEGCDFVLSDPASSRRHFAVRESGGAYRVEDLGSTHGTSVNGWATKSAELRDGDTIGVGETVFSFVTEAGEAGRGLTGKVVAGYQVIERIGRGGMGTVYRAKQVALDRDVALKVLSARYSGDKTFINRFFKEAQAAARLNHPNVVQIYDVREEKGLYLISMEMMDGGTVEELSRDHEGPLPIERILAIARDAARGLVYAGKKGIVHQDIKPDNLMLNSEGQVKISDLGLAHDATAEMSRQGEDGIFGTPHFIAPEQAQGKGVDARSDIYSLGASLYRLITGRTPFTGDSVREIILKQINEEPPPIQELRPDCPQDLVDLVAVMMAKDPEERFENAEALLAAIESLDSSGRIRKAGAGTAVKVSVLAGVLVVLGLVAFIALRPGEDPDPKPGPGPVEPVGDGQAAAEAAALEAALRKKQLENRVNELFIAAQRFELELARQGKIDDPAALEELEAMFREAHVTGPETSKADEARAESQRIVRRIEEIRAENERLAAEAEERARRLGEAWNAVEARVREETAEHRYAAAVAAIEAARAELAEDDYPARLDALRTQTSQAARDRRDVLLGEADEAVAAKDFDRARALLLEAAERFEAQAGEGLAFEPVRRAARDLVTRADDVERLEREQQRADLAHDRALLLDVLKSTYLALPASMDYDRMLAEVKGARAALKTGEGAERLDALAVALERMLALRAFLIATVSDPEKKRLTVSSTARNLPSGTVVAADAEGLTIDRRRGSPETLPWSKVDFAEAQHHLLRRIADETPRQLLDYARATLEAGVLDETGEALEKLEDKELGELADEFRAVSQDYASEVTAKETVALIRTLHERARGGDQQAWFPLYRELRDFFRNHADSRAMIRNTDGSRLFPDER